MKNAGASDGRNGSVDGGLITLTNPVGAGESAPVTVHRTTGVTGAGAAASLLKAYGSVDMEAATPYAVARHFAFAATALPTVWNQLEPADAYWTLSPSKNKPASTQPTPPYTKPPWK